jgi:hypothetical protein
LSWGEGVSSRGIAKGKMFSLLPGEKENIFIGRFRAGSDCAIVTEFDSETLPLASTGNTSPYLFGNTKL